MADSNLRTIIDNLSVETLRDYLEQSLQQNPQQREHFISTFREQSERDALLAALNNLDDVLYGNDNEEYGKADYDYDDGLFVEGLIILAESVIDDSCKKFLQQGNYALYQDFLVQAAELIMDFDLELTSFEVFDTDPEDGTQIVIDDLFKRLKACAEDKQLPEDMQVKLLQKLNEICIEGEK